MKAKIVYGIIEKYGKMMRINYPDGTQIYMTKKGLILSLLKSKFRKGWNKKSKRFNVSFSVTEIDLFIQALEKCNSEWKKLEAKKKEKKK